MDHWTFLGFLAQPLGRSVSEAIRGRIDEWAVESQQGARRNALVASTALAEVRAEHDEVSGYVEAAIARREVRAVRSREAALA